MTTPSGILLDEAEPKENASGEAPKAMAKVVIKIGRSRSLDPSITEVNLLSPFLLF